MHPVEALKARVLELLRSQPSREAITRTLLAEGHPEGLVAAAIEIVFEERQARAARSREAADEDSRRGMVAKLVGVQVVRQIDDEDYGDIRGGSMVRAPYVQSTLSALLFFALALWSAWLGDLWAWAYAVAPFLALVGVYYLRTTHRSFGRRGTVLIVCAEGLIEVTRQGRIRGHSWSKVELLARGRTSPNSRNSQYAANPPRTIHCVELRIEGRHFEVRAEGRGAGVFSAALSSQIDAYARR